MSDKKRNRVDERTLITQKEMRGLGGLLWFVIITYIVSIQANAQGLIGAVKGKYEVNQGNFTYRLPLQLPKGVNNFSPNLTIGYHSNKRFNGTLGVGFSLNGFSTIQWCHETTQEAIQDQTKKKQLCLNGEKLVLMDPTQTYGGNNTHYQTQRTQYRRIAGLI